MYYHFYIVQYRVEALNINFVTTFEKGGFFLFARTGRDGMVVGNSQ